MQTSGVAGTERMWVRHFDMKHIIIPTIYKEREERLMYIIDYSVIA